MLNCLGLTMAPRANADTNTTQRVGVYDSRVVAYAWFVSDAQQAKLSAQIKAAKAAQSSGDAKAKELADALRKMQDQMHREVFSTAPANEALAALKNRLPEIETSTGVSSLVSKWDKAALEKSKGAEQIDITDQLANALLKPTEAQARARFRASRRQFRFRWKNATNSSNREKSNGGPRPRARDSFFRGTFYSKAAKGAKKSASYPAGA